MSSRTKTTPRPRNTAAALTPMDDESNIGESESVKVSVRVRPFDSRETSASLISVLAMNSKKRTVTIFNSLPKENNAITRKKTFQFDHVFWSLDSPDESGGEPVGQAEVYATIGRPLVAHAFNGFNSCLFAYGQTGSGKTYTMMGADPNAVGGADAGVTPRLCLELFQMRERIEAEGHSKWSVEVGYIEVYNERVSDLLAKRKKGSKEEVFVDVREHPTRGVFIEGQELREVSSLDEVLGLIEAGNRVRHTAATKMNDRSSRSHAIFMLLLREERSMQTATGQTITTAGKNSRMNLVDLAGSERVAQSEVVGQQFSEARHINLSLTTLGRVIDMLADMTKNKDSQWSMPPYRESKLTFLLKDSLGGNSKTFMIATVSPSGMNYEETLSTLRYASRARDIVNVTKVNEDPRARRIRELEEQMEQMRKDIQGKDPAYVAELEEKLRLLEAETQKRAADLQALEREREKNEIREKMLRVTEAERQELLSRAGALERQAFELSRNNEKLLREREEKERRLLEQMRRREAEMENNQERWNTALERERVLVLQLRRDCDFYRVQLEAMESRYGLTVDYVECLVEISKIFYEKGAASVMKCQLAQLRESEAKWVSSMKALRKDHDNVAVERARLSESLRTMEAKNKELDAANEALAVQLAQVEGEILRLQDRFTNTVSDRDALAEHLQVIEVTKAELETLYNEANKKCEEFERKLNSPPVCTHHSRKFEGEEWDALLHGRPSELLDVFTNDVSTACRVSKDSVNNVTFALGSLTCEFDVTHDADTTAADIDKRIAEHPFYLMQQLYDNRYGEKKGIDRATDEIKRLERQLKKNVKDSDEKAKKIKEIEKQKEELVQENHKQKENNIVLQKELETNAEIHEKIVKQLHDSIKNNNSLTNSLQNLEKNHKNVKRELELLTAEREELAENLRATEDAKAEVERNLESVTAEREELAENLRATEDAKAEVERNLESVTAEREELAENLRATEDAKAEVERNLESVIAEREELAENLRATEDAKAEVERNLESVTAEREELAENLRATEDAKAEVERNLESVTAERNEAVLGISKLERSRRKLRDAYVNLQRKSAENDVRLRVRHDRLSFTDGSAGNAGNEFSVTKKLLGARGLFGKENNAQ